ncbi:MAG: PhoH family protein [Pseudomonadota bacterium]|nr:PhoH family protein [Pseudomonadota bacterium]
MVKAVVTEGTVSKTEQPLYLTFNDNSLLPALFGNHDRHLAQVEKVLGVWVTSRGNKLVISGAPDSTAAAERALVFLYGQLERGIEISDGEVYAAISSARLGDHSEKREGGPILGELFVQTPKKKVFPRSANQVQYLRALREKGLVFGIGPAGTGKTYLAVATALFLMMRGEVERLVLSRPAVEAGERLGFLPGDLREKVDPYLRPLYDALYDMMPAERVNNYLSRGDIEVAPLAFMRGRTLANSFVILDEAQNTTAVQMKMFLTRLGDNSRMSVTGDLSQIDLPRGVESGLQQALQVVGRVEDTAVVRFSAHDVVRHQLVTKIVNAYADFENRQVGRTGEGAEQGASGEGDG